MSAWSPCDWGQRSASWSGERKYKGKSRAPRNRNQPVTLTEDEVEIFLVVSFLPFSVGFMLYFYGILPRSLLRRLTLFQGLDLLFSRAFGETCHEPQIFKIPVWQTWVRTAWCLRWFWDGPCHLRNGIWWVCLYWMWRSPEWVGSSQLSRGRQESKLHSSKIVKYGCNFVLPNVGRNEA